MRVARLSEVAEEEDEAARGEDGGMVRCGLADTMDTVMAGWWQERAQGSCSLAKLPIVSGRTMRWIGKVESAVC